MTSVVAVHRSGNHSFSKPTVDRIELVAGLGVVGDAHSGAQVRHRSRVASDPTQPNLRQVHLLHSELLEDLNKQGFNVTPGSIGENVTTGGIDLLRLSTGTILELGDEAMIVITGLRNPCVQLDDFRPGLLQAVTPRAADGSIERRAGVMAVVVAGGTVQAGDPIRVTQPAGPHRPLQRV